MTLGVVIVTHGDRKEFLEEAYTSAVGVADQIEVVENLYGPTVVNTPSGIFQYRGIADALNAGVKRLQTEWVMRLDDDNILFQAEATRLKAQLKSAFWGVTTFPAHMSNRGEFIVAWGGRLDLITLEHQNCVAAGSWFRRETWEDLGGFEAMEFEDWRFWLKCARAQVASYHHDFAVYNHRLHGSNLGGMMLTEEQEYWKGVVLGS